MELIKHKDICFITFLFILTFNLNNNYITSANNTGMEKETISFIVTAQLRGSVFTCAYGTYKHVPHNAIFT